MRAAFHILAIALSAGSLCAQTATLRGRVTDESGAVVPSARITLTGAGGSVATAGADNFGAYSFTGVTAGDYALRAAAPDLAQPKPIKISLKPGVQTMNLTLVVASKVEQVTVQSETGPALSTDATNNAGALVLRGADLDALSDDPDDLMADLQALAGPSAGPNGGSIFIDGFSSGDLPAKNSIREIRINQNPFSPEYDKLGYGKIEIFTKPGSDRYHGTVDYNLGTQFWNSRNPYSSQKAPFLLNEFEGGAGGPLGKHTSFTVDAQRNMVDNGSITSAVALDPHTLAISPLSSVLTTPQRLTKVSPRVDHQLNDKTTLTFRYGIIDAGIRDAGIGGLDLVSRGHSTDYTNQTVQASETAVLGAYVVETRFQYYRNALRTTANSGDPGIRALDAFNGGGSLIGHSFDTQNNFELQNYLSALHGAHTLKFGIRARGQLDDNASPQNYNGTFTFAGGELEPTLGADNQPLPPQLAPISSIERYRRTLLFQTLGYSPAQTRALGGGATQFTLGGGDPFLSVHQVDVGIFAGDDWRLRPNLTLSGGLRYETQTHVHGHGDLAPRLALAWAPRAGGKTRPKTVLRAGFGIFYDRFGLANTLAARRYNGVVQQQFVVAMPDFFPNLPSAATLNGVQSTQVIQEVSARLRTLYILQSALTLERQLPSNTTVAVTYTNSHGLHALRSQVLNAPSRPVFLMESSGVYNQNQLIANVTSKLSSGVSLFGFYVLNRAMSNTDGVGTFPANPGSSSGEYGPASTDVRHRVTAGGSISMKWNVRISPFFIVQSGAPFDITSGNDPYGTTLFNARPGVPSDSNKAGLIRTVYGLLDPNPSPGEALLSRNAGRGPGQITMNLRVAKTIGFGERGGGEQRPSGAPGGPPATAQPTGGALRGIIGSPSTTHRYNLSLSMSIRNLLNHTNPGPIIGGITSPLFGLSTQIAGTPNGEGFYETANNRRLEMQLRLTF